MGQSISPFGHDFPQDDAWPESTPQLKDISGAVIAAAVVVSSGRSMSRGEKISDELEDGLASSLAVNTGRISFKSVGRILGFGSCLEKEVSMIFSWVGFVQRTTKQSIPDGQVPRSQL